jgi:hypothetical protein
MAFFAVQTDVVGVFDQNYNQVFRNARPLKAVVKETSKSMEHPLESGATIVDHRVILPVEIELSLIVQSDPEDVQDIYRIIRQHWLNADLLNVHTLAGVYENQYITDLPHEESPDQYGTIVIGLKLKQLQFAVTQVMPITITPSAPSNSTSINRGNIQPQEVKSSALLDIGQRILGGL